MYEIVNKGLNNLNGVYSGVTRHNIIKIEGHNLRLRTSMSLQKSVGTISSLARDHVGHLIYTASRELAVMPS
jgi:hypothetical protein